MVTDKKLVHLIILISKNYLAVNLGSVLPPRDDEMSVGTFVFTFFQPKLN